MPLVEISFETADVAPTIREGILKTLASKGYKVQQDTQTKIVAKHGLSATYYAHVVEIDVLPPPPSGTGQAEVTLRIDDGIKGAEYLKRLATELVKELPTLRRKIPEVTKAILWQKDEVLVNNIDAQEFIEDTTQNFGFRTGHNGFLIVTNQRIIFACKLGFLAKDYAVTYGISLEDVMSISAGKVGINDKLVILEKSGQHKDFLKRRIDEFIPAINAAISERRGQLEVRRDKERIQVVLDFSSLKDVLAKGGVVMSSYNCPKCNAMIEIPEAGKVMVCKYCGAPIKPIDIFDRIKSLL